MKMMMLEIATESRKSLLTFQQSANDQLQLAKQKDNFNHLMLSMMNLAFWLRADLELLLRVAFWQDLSESDFGARIISDEMDFYKTTLKRMGFDETRNAVVLEELTSIIEKKKMTPVNPEGNEAIIKKLTYHKVELKKLFSCFHKALSKFAHPDPFFIAFPDQCRQQIESNLMRIFALCKKQLDKEWELLESHLKEGIKN